MNNYQQVLYSLLGKLSINQSSISDLPDRIGICFDSDIPVNIELLSHFQDEKIILTGKVGSVSEFGTFFDVNALIAKGNFYLAKANGCTLSVHDESQTVYIQYALPLLPGDFTVVEVTTRLLEQVLINIVEFIKHVRLEMLH